MTGFNHASSGAIIGLAVTNPIVALPLVFGLHLALDSLPHYGEKNDIESVNERRWLIVTLSDGVLTLGFLGFLAFTGQWWLLVVSLVAISPDTPFIIEVIADRIFGIETNLQNRGSFTKFHSRIQTLERPWGWALEIIYAAIFATTLLSLL